MSNVLILLIEFYQKTISKIVPSACRFQPSCSQYSIDALKKYGTIKGMYFSIKRIIRCHPYSSGGYDPLK
ncbi:MAG: membrane protein insertion efficiency factor YidD [Actinobacteria bacterium]|nr:membrane protein insertion efficiency factor YidD [Actinomycetota bacterium]